MENEKMSDKEIEKKIIDFENKLDVLIENNFNDFDGKLLADLMVTFECQIVGCIKLLFEKRRDLFNTYFNDNITYDSLEVEEDTNILKYEILKTINESTKETFKDLKIKEKLKGSFNDSKYLYYKN